MGSTGKAIVTVAKEAMVSYGSQRFFFLGLLAAYLIARAMEEGYAIEADLQEGRLSIRPSCQAA